MRNLGHGRPSWDLASNDRQSDRTKDFAVWCMDPVWEFANGTAVSMSTWRVRRDSFHDPVFCFRQGKIDSYYNSVMPALKRTRLTASAWRQTGVSTVC